jgi:hypothetical protein
MPKREERILCGGLGIGYTVSEKDGFWYAHMCGYSYIPVMGSFSESKAEAMKWAAASMGLPLKEYMMIRRKYGIK